MENNEPKQPQGKTYDGGVTEEQINKWKAAHKRVVRIDVTDGDDLHESNKDRRGERCHGTLRQLFSGRRPRNTRRCAAVHGGDGAARTAVQLVPR